MPRYAGKTGKTRKPDPTSGEALWEIAIVNTCSSQLTASTFASTSTSTSLIILTYLRSRKYRILTLLPPSLVLEDRRHGLFLSVWSHLQRKHWNTGTLNQHHSNPQIVGQEAFQSSSISSNLAIFKKGMQWTLIKNDGVRKWQIHGWSQLSRPRRCQAITK